MAQARKRREEERRLEEEEAARLAEEAELNRTRTFHDILEARTCVLSFVSLACAAPAFRASKETRSLLSALVTVHITFSVQNFKDVKHVDEDAVPGRRAYEEMKRRCFKVRERLPQSIAAGPLPMYLRLRVKEQPYRRAVLNRSLARAVPLIRWEDCKQVKLVTYENIESLDKITQKDVVAIGGADVPLLSAERDFYRSLRKITLTMTQFLNLSSTVAAVGEELLMPKVTRLKVFLQDAGFNDTEFRDLYAAFPGLKRLHLVTLPAGLLPLCGPGIMAPPDLRLTLSEESSHMDRHENFFVASHLMSLPFSWGGDFLKRVVRLQCSELNEDLRGLSLEKLVDSMKGGGMPLLRRLGTVSARAACHFDVSREDCKLEELVVVTELEDVKDFFSCFLSFEQRKKRGSLRRLAVHIVCSDGAARVKMDVENAICAGWYNIAAHLMRADGWVVFSTSSKALQETAIGQLPWFLPEQFSLDTVNYGGSLLPCSTPLERALPYYGTDGVQQPSGTLVCGNLRPDAAALRNSNDSLAENSIQSTASMAPSSPSTSSRPSHIGGRPQTGQYPSTPKQATAPGGRSRKSIMPRMGETDSKVAYQEWMGMYLVDAIEALVNAAEAQRAEFMNARPGEA